VTRVVPPSEALRGSRRDPSARTVGGSLAHADPAAEIALVAVTLGATLIHRRAPRAQRLGRPIFHRTNDNGVPCDRLTYRGALSALAWRRRSRTGFLGAMISTLLREIGSMLDADDLEPFCEVGAVIRIYPSCDTDASCTTHGFCDLSFRCTDRAMMAPTCRFRSATRSLTRSSRRRG
jgi:hypothetical protein